MKKYFSLGLMGSATILTSCSSNDDHEIINDPLERFLF